MVGWQFPPAEAGDDGARRMASEPITPTASTLAIAIPVNERARMRDPACATDRADFLVSPNSGSERMDAPFTWLSGICRHDLSPAVRKSGASAHKPSRFLFVPV
jgi:hypothetical protein